MKLFISADIEGTTGIAHWNETEKNHPDWQYFADQMSREVAAACQGAIDAGYDEIWVKDAHDSARNINPRLLPECVRIFRGWTGEYPSMMAGLDATFDGVVFTGYHSGAGWSTNPLSHTMNGRNNQVLINGVKASELTLNALCAAHFGVPVYCVTGDRGLCEYIQSVNPNIAAVPVNEGVGGGVLSIHPDLAVKRIRETVADAARRSRHDCLFPMPGTFFVRVSFKRHQDALNAAQYPGVTCQDDVTAVFQCDQYMQLAQTLKWIL